MKEIEKMETQETENEDKKRLLCRFKSESGEVVGDLMDLPLNCTIEQLTLICNALLQQVRVWNPGTIHQFILSMFSGRTYTISIFC